MPRPQEGFRPPGRRRRCRRPGRHRGHGPRGEPPPSHPPPSSVCRSLPCTNAPSGKLRGAVRTHSTSIPQMGMWFPPQWYLAPGLETAAVHVLSEFFTTFRGRWALFRCFCHRLSCPTTSCAPLCLRDGRSWAPAWAPPSVSVATLMRPFGSRQTLEGHHPPTLPFHPRRFHQLPCPLLSSAPLADTYYFQSDRRVPPTS